MNFDFMTAMVVAVVITGVIWAADAWVWAPRRRRELARLTEGGANKADPERLKRLAKEPMLVEYARSFFPVILIVLLLRAFLVEPFRIPSGSMMPTLLNGDFILVNKYTYGIRLPVVGTKIIDNNTPQHGDVIVFRFPKDPSTDFIKRVVGVPGDKIGYYQKTVYINGEAVAQQLEGSYPARRPTSPGAGAMVKREWLGEAEHEILIEVGKPSKEGEVLVPPGHYFVMGDNRDNSNDSRFWGFVPEQNLVGKAFMIWMNWDMEDGGVGWSRIGSGIE